MKITAVRTRVARLPLRKKAVARIGLFDTMWDVLVDVDTDESITGSTYLWAFSPAGTGALRQVD